MGSSLLIHLSSSWRQGCTTSLGFHEVLKWNWFLQGLEGEAIPQSLHVGYNVPVMSLLCFLKKKFHLFIYCIVYTCVCLATCHSAHVEIRGQSPGTWSLFLFVVPGIKLRSQGLVSSTITRSLWGFSLLALTEFFLSRTQCCVPLPLPMFLQNSKLVLTMLTSLPVRRSPAHK